LPEETARYTGLISKSNKEKRDIDLRFPLVYKENWPNAPTHYIFNHNNTYKAPSQMGN